MAKQLCAFAKTCPIYQEKETINATPIVLYKNVFCNRGSQGWANCHQFSDFEKKKLNKST
jgi:hypothetical protein